MNVNASQSRGFGLPSGLVITVCVVVFTGCMPASYRLGTRLLEQEDYEEAVVQLSKASEERPNSEEIEGALAVARRGAADGRLTAQKNISERDLWGRLRNFRWAKAVDPTHPVAEEKEAETIRRIDAVNSASEAIRRVSENDPRRAWELRVSIEPYAPHSSDIKGAIEATRDVFYAALVHEANDALLREDLPGARPLIDEAVALVPDRPGARASLATFEAIQFIGKNNFEEALTKLREARSLDRNNPAMRARMTAVRRAVLSRRLLAAKSQLSASANLAALLRTASEVTDAVSISEKDDPERTALEETRGKAKARAARLYADNGRRALARQLPMTALVSFRAAHALDRSVENSLYMHVEQAISDVRTKLGFNLAVHFQDDTRKTAGFDQLLHEQFLESLAEAKAPNVNVVQREHLQNMILDEEALGQMFSSKDTPALDLETSDALILGRIVRYDVRDSGRDRPVRLSSRYISGYRWVPNPDYPIAEQRVRDAEHGFERARHLYIQQKNEMEAARRQMASSGLAGAIAAGVLSVVSTAGVELARSQVAEAQRELAQTPRELQEEVISGYQYQEYRVSTSAELRVAWNLIDRRTSLKHRIEVVEGSHSEKGLLRENVESTDQSGLKNVPGPIPEIDDVLEKARNDLTAKLLPSMVSTVLDYSRRRFFVAAEEAKRRQRFDQAVENYLMFLETRPPDASPEFATANEFVLAHALVSDDQRHLAPITATPTGDELWPERVSVTGF